MVITFLEGGNNLVFSLGDIQDLYDTKLTRGHAAAFSDDCDLPSTHEMVRSVGMQVKKKTFLKHIIDLGGGRGEIIFVLS